MVWAIIHEGSLAGRSETTGVGSRIEVIFLLGFLCRIKPH